MNRQPPALASGAQSSLISDADSNTAHSRPDPCLSNGDEPSPGAAAGTCGIAPAQDALFLDVDGTLLQIAQHPDAVRVSEEVLAALAALLPALDGALALVSGRSIDNLDDLFAPLRLPCAGVHGLERRGADGIVHREDAAALLAPLRSPLAAFVERNPGLLLEDKGQSLALHFRNAPACADEAEAFLRRLLADGGAPLELKSGKMVLEVKPGNADKGTAIAAFLQEYPFAGRRPVFIGDDVTDEDGFAVVNAAGGLSIRVGQAGAATVARHRLPDEDAVLACLRRCLGDAGGASPGEPVR